MVVQPDPVEALLTTYNELNPSVIEELHEEPSPLEFMRYVARNTPFVVRNGASDWNATRTWTADYLRDFLRQHKVNVAVTPEGNADCPTLHPDGKLVFAKPWEEDQPFPEFLDYLQRQELDRSEFQSSEIRYAQTQNDNLRHEYVSLFDQVQRDIPFARIALEKEPDAINMWIGNSHSVTAMHLDNYENIYVQIQGQKHFVLLPPHCHPCVNKKPLPPATYARSRDGENLELIMDHSANGDEVPDVPFAIWDPDCPEENATQYSKLAQPMRVTLNKGDMLYLPAMWYHKVSQSCSEEGICVAVNYWYDMDFSGPLFPLASFVRSVTVPHEIPE
ncbi:putative phospholipase [Coniella lustricola]|uniref:Putative phospholipase n=1 Tax=Coniella lustricola TaxID=2025994 RepID=A0A2T3A1L2_9PEZI|nr:putative phospholipase [Coniella lustricola]